MILTIDIGNTNIVCGVYQGDNLIWHTRFKTDRNRTSDEYYALISTLKKETFSFSIINKIAIASVVPDMTRMWQHMIEKYFDSKAIIVNGYSPLGLTFAVEDPSFIGADLITNAYAAWKKYSSSCIIVDFGTATTIQVVSAEGKFLGAIIAPGIKTASAELFDRAALLSEIELTTPEHTLGTNTKDALLSGIIRGHAFMTESFIKQINIEYSDDSPFKAIATGGIADLITPLIPSIDILDKTLTLDGLRLAAIQLST